MVLRHRFQSVLVDLILAQDGMSRDVFGRLLLFSFPVRNSRGFNG